MVTTTGSSVEVHLTEPRFLVDDGGHGNWFSGRADAVGVTFMLDDWDPINSFFYPSIVERLPDNTYLVPAGMATMSPTNGGVSGLMSFGEISHYEAFPFGPTLGECHSSAIRLTLTPR
jgi:hypothetical protein